MELRDVPHVGEPEWDPVWAVCEELDVPVCLHAGGVAPVPYAPSSTLGEAVNAVLTPLSNAAVAALFLFSRVALRHPADCQLSLRGKPNCGVVSATSRR